MAEDKTESKTVELKEEESKILQFPPGVHSGEEEETPPTPEQTQEGPSMNVQEWSIEELNQFISETYRFVNQLHLEHVTLTSILLERGVITPQELDKMFNEIRMRHEQAIKERINAESMEQMGADPNAPEADPIAVELDLGNKPIAGRKPPQGHNSGD